MSLTFVYSIYAAGDIVKLLSRPCSPIIQVFLNPRVGTQFRREPLQRRAQNTRGGNMRFSTEIARLSRKRYEIGPQLHQNTNRKS